MEDTTVDLSLETTESLEKPDATTINKWRTRRLKIAGIAFCLLCVGVVGIWFYSPPQRFGGSLIGSMIAAPRDFLSLLFVLAMTGAVVISPVVILVEVIRLGLGIPKAPKNSTDAVRRFYSNTIHEALGSPDIDPEAYMYLLNQAKSQFNGIDDFVGYYKKVIATLRKDIRRHFKVNVSGRVYVVKNINELSSEGSMRTYEVNIEATLTSGLGTTSSPKKKVGTVLIRELCTVTSIGGRWYLTSGKWTGRLPDDVLQGQLEDETYDTVNSLEQISAHAKEGPALLFTCTTKKSGGVPLVQVFEERVMPVIGPLLNNSGIPVLWADVGSASELTDYLKGKGLRSNGCILLQNGEVLKHSKLPLLPGTMHEAYIKAAKEVLQGYRTANYVPSGNKMNADRKVSSTESADASLSDPLLPQATCKKCGSKGLDYDKYWKEYTCKSCGWQTKEIE